MENKPIWLPQHKRNIDKHFLEWFIGFSEGDGSFSATKAGNFYRHDFIINQKHPQALYKIRTNLGFGTINKYENKKQRTFYYRYVVSDLEGIARLIHIFYGNLLLTKTRVRFNTWLEEYNKRPCVRERVDFPVAPLPTSAPLGPPSGGGIDLNSAWLSGSIDAEGCFNVGASYVPSDSKDSLELRFIIDQKNERLFLDRVRQALHNAGRIEHRLECDNMVIDRYVPGIKPEGLKKDLSPKGPMSQRREAEINCQVSQHQAFTTLFDYLDKHKSKSPKHVDYVRFKKIWIRLNDDISRSDSNTKSFRRSERLLLALKAPSPESPDQDPVD